MNLSCHISWHVSRNCFNIYAVHRVFKWTNQTENLVKTHWSKLRQLLGLLLIRHMIYEYEEQQSSSTVLVVSVFAIGPNFASSNPAEAIKSAARFPLENKWNSRSQDFTARYKSLEVWKIHFEKKKFIAFASSSCFAIRWLLIGLPESPGERIRFSLSITFHHGSSWWCITCGVNRRSVYGRRSHKNF
jgi:hypothetical protein